MILLFCKFVVITVSVMQWYTVAGLLCLFGALKEFRLTEPYLYNYQHETLNISDTDLNGLIYPIWTYTYLIALIPVLLLTDILLYKPILIFGAFCYISVWITLICFKSILSQQFGQAFFGFATATEVAYFAYIYVKVEQKNFSKVTSWTRAALLAGKCSSYFISEFFILFHWGTFRTLNYITISALFCAVILSIFIPNIFWKDIVNRRVEYQNSTIKISTSLEGRHPESYGEFAKEEFKNFKKQFITIYSDWKVLKWSFWWAMASCGEFQVGNYAQTLWGQLQNSSSDNTFNGFIEASCPFIAMIVVLLMEKPKINWNRWGEPCLIIASFCDCILLYLMAKAQQLWIMYACYIFFRVAYQAMITTAQYNIVCRIKSNNLGFIFGINTFIALFLQTILTVIVVDKSVMGLSIRKQFYVYSTYHAVMGFIFFAAFIVQILKRVFKTRTNLSQKNDDVVERL